MASDRITNNADFLKITAWLSYGTVTWYAAAAITATAAGMLSGSIALSGFGFESIIQTMVAALAIWRFEITRGKSVREVYLAKERRLLFVLGIIFFLLALYILNESGSKLYYREMPGKSAFGIVLSMLTFIVMLVLAFLKMEVSKATQSRILLADAKENAIRCYLSLVLFLGLWLPSRYGLWWADAVAAVFMVPFFLREGWKAVEDSKRSPPKRPRKAPHTDG